MRGYHHLGLGANIQQGLRCNGRGHDFGIDQYYFVQKCKTSLHGRQEFDILRKQ